MRKEDGRECWYASSDLTPIDGKGALPSRTKARAAARQEALDALEVSLKRHLEEFDHPWPGAEFGKIIIGRCITNAIHELRDAVGLIDEYENNENEE